MHTLDGQPAQFLKRSGQITFGGKSIREFATSLKQIHEEQSKTLEYRKKRKYPEYYKMDYIILYHK